MNIHAKIFAILRNSQKVKKLPLTVDLDIATDEDLYRRFFINFRRSDIATKGLRLSYEGLSICQLFFEHYEIPLSENFHIKGKHIIFLDQTCTLPYYLTTRHFILFEGELAMRAKLVGDLDILINAFEGIIP
jgi:hypothetical protein